MIITGKMWKSLVNFLDKKDYRYEHPRLCGNRLFFTNGEALAYLELDFTYDGVAVLSGVRASDKYLVKDAIELNEQGIWKNGELICHWKATNGDFSSWADDVTSNLDNMDMNNVKYYIESKNFAIASKYLKKVSDLAEGIEHYIKNCKPVDMLLAEKVNITSNPVMIPVIPTCNNGKMGMPVIYFDFGKVVNVFVAPLRRK